MIRSLPPSDVRDIDFIPHAIFNLPVEAFVREDNVIATQSDDLDNFLALYFYMPSNAFGRNIAIAIKHYAGFPEGTSSLYLSSEIRSLDVVQEAIKAVIVEFNIRQDALKWAREEGPEENIQRTH